MRRHDAGNPLDSGLLVVLDEAANTPLTQLPKWLAAVTGYRIQLVTIWQSLSQLDAIYGEDAGAMVGHHRSKVFWGTTDKETVAYLSGMLGSEHHPAHLSTTGPDDPSHPATTEVALAPSNVIRQIPRGRALLLHGEMPPIDIETL